MKYATATCAVFVLSAISISTLVACSDENSTPTATISGIAATGAPLDNADITITCADATTKTGTTDGKGAFSIDVSNGCPAPYVLVASKTVGDAKQSLVSVQPTAVTGASVVNITTLTHAISATLATNGDPLSLVSDITTEKSNITTSVVSDRNTALVASLAQAITAAGVQGTPNLFSTTFAADRSGLDKVLDNLKIVVGPSGVTITNPAGSRVDDMANVGNSSVAPNLSSASITINKYTNFSAGLAPLPATTDDASVVDAIQSALNECFALQKNDRISSDKLLGKCATLETQFVATDYLHDGKNFGSEFSRWLSSDAYNGAKFLKPEIVRFYSSSATDSRALVRLGLQRTDGVGEWFMSVAEKSGNTGNTWKLRGNQRDYKILVNGYILREEQLQARGTSRPKGSYFHSGINLYFGGKDATVDYVRVKGPGLPDVGVFLRHLADCDSYFAIAASATATPVACTSLYRMQYRKATASDPENGATQAGFGKVAEPYYAPAVMTNVEIQAIAPFAAYRFEIFKLGSTTPIVYVDRLRSRPVALGTNSDIGSSEVDKLVFNTRLSQETKDLIDPTSATAFVGGTSFTMRWSNVSGAPPVNSVQVQSKPIGGATGRLYQDETNVKFSDSFSVLNNSTDGWGNMTMAVSSGNFNLVQLRGRDMNELQYFQNWRY